MIGLTVKVAMIEFMQSVFGTYQGTENCIDFQYVGAVAIFCIVLISVFKVITMIFRRK